MCTCMPSLDASAPRTLYQILTMIPCQILCQKTLAYDIIHITSTIKQYHDKTWLLENSVLIVCTYYLELYTLRAFHSLLEVKKCHPSLKGIASVHYHSTFSIWCRLSSYNCLWWALPHFLSLVVLKGFFLENLLSVPQETEIVACDP